MGFALVIAFMVGMIVGDCAGTAPRLKQYHVEACELVCKRHKAGAMHSVVDQTFCLCKDGRVFKRDRSRLYIAMGK